MFVPALFPFNKEFLVGLKKNKNKTLFLPELVFFFFFFGHFAKTSKEHPGNHNNLVPIQQKTGEVFDLLFSP